MVKNMLTRKLFRDMYNNKLQFIAMLLLCTLGTWVFSGLDGGWRIQDASIEAYFSDQNLASYWIQLPDADRDSLRRISNIPGIDDVQMRINLEFDTDLPSEGSLQVYGYDDAPRINIPVIKSGEMLETDDNRGCLIEEQFAVANDLQVGDRINLSLGEFKQAFTIRALIVSPEHMLTSKDVSPDPLHYGFALVNSASIAAFPHSELLVDLSDDADASLIQSEIESLYPYAMVIDQTNHTSTLRVRNDVMMYRNISYIFPLLAFAVAVMIVLTTLTRMIENQRIQLGTLKALGYGGSKITRHYMCYALYPSLIGSLIGIYAGKLTLPQVLWDLQARQYTFPPRIDQPISLPTWLICCISVGLCCLVCYIVYRKSATEVAATLLRPKPPKEGSRNLLERIPALWTRLSFNTKMVVRNMFRNKLRTTMTLIGILCCNMLIITTFGLQDTVRNAVGRYYDGTIQYTLRADLTSEAGTLQSYQKRFNADQIDGLMIKPSSLRTSSESRMTTLNVLSSEQRSFNIGKDYAYTEIPTSGIAVTEKLCKALGATLGDTLDLWLVGETQCLKLEITKIVYSNLGQGAYMDEAYWNSLKKGAFIPNALLITNPDSASLEAISRMDELDTIKYPEVQHANNLKILDSLTTIFSVLGGTALGLAFVICYNMGLLNFIERSREYATLKVLGYHQKEIKRLIIRESNLVSILGTLIGILPGIWLIAVIMQTCETEQTVYGTYVTLKSILLACVITFSFSRLIQGMLTRKVRSIDMVSSLKSVE